jgi:transcriptional regulator with XRE-family HTH domain
VKRSKVGQRIRLARIKLGLTQKELAHKLKISQPSIAGWETGVNYPTAKNLLKLSEALKIPIDEIMKAG